MVQTDSYCLPDLQSFEEIRAANVSGKYVAFAQSGKKYDASYSADYQNMFYAIPSTEKILGFVSVSDLPIINAQNAVLKGAYQFAGGWMEVTEISRLSAEAMKERNLDWRVRVKTETHTDMGTKALNFALRNPDAKADREKTELSSVFEESQAQKEKTKKKHHRVPQI